jgi:hypothetical protein
VSPIARLRSIARQLDNRVPGDCAGLSLGLVASPPNPLPFHPTPFYRQAGRETLEQVGKKLLMAMCHRCGRRAVAYLDRVPDHDFSESAAH